MIMNDRDKRIERQKQNRLEKLGTNNPVCTICGETHWACFELHHVAGCKYCELLALHCKNCHSKSTALQKGHPPPVGGSPSMEECIGQLLLGLADFFELLIDTLRKFGEYLIEQARIAASGSDDAGPQAQDA
jgi:hypothetical protein